MTRFPLLLESELTLAPFTSLNGNKQKWLTFVRKSLAAPSIVKKGKRAIKANKSSDFRMGFFILIHCAQDDYKSLVDKYCLVRDDFERKMTLAAKHFQDVESAHLKQMREFIESYCQIVDNNNNLLGRVRILFLKSHISTG